MGWVLEDKKVHTENIKLQGIDISTESQALSFDSHMIWGKALLALSFFIFKVSLIIPF